MPCQLLDWCVVDEYCCWTCAVEIPDPDCRWCVVIAGCNVLSVTAECE